ncbi:MAG: 30S ribosomal protein S1 [Holosporales bacterium]|jgi:small subunit ribosomal protein S1|nr:30S ribosomal protein S1 [Holosporales bacterium]
MVSSNPTVEESFAELFEKFSQAMPGVGSVLDGVVKGFDNEFVLIDIGCKSDGRVPLKEFSQGKGEADLKIGDTVKVYMEHYEDRNGDVVLSREKAIREESWVDLKDAFTQGKQVTGVITGRVRGGFNVDIGGVMAFLPGSQVDVRPMRDVTSLVGVPQPFKIFKMENMYGNIVVSRRAVLEEENAEGRAKIVSNLDEGQVVTGIVKNITNYGAFVDIGGIDGLLHNGDIAWNRISHPSEVLEIGQRIQVKIIKFNRETQRISLGLKQLDNDPWEGIESKFKSGDRVTGKVTNTAEYGIFVELLTGVEGLVYVNEISWKKNINPHKVAAIGDKIEVIVLDVDPIKRRVSLGIKQLEPNPWEQVAGNFPVDTEFEGEVTNVTNFGLFVKVMDDIDGIVRLNDLSWSRPGEEAIKDYKRGDTVKVKVLEVDGEKGRISLGVKQLTEDPYKGALDNLSRGSVVTCTVLKTIDDGIEVEFSGGMIGTIKKAELSKDRQERRIERFTVGEKFDAKIISLEKTERRFLLSVRALEIEEEKKAMAEYGSVDSGASLGDILGSAINKAKDS